MGLRAAQQLLAQIEGSTSGASQIVLPAQLIIRSSTAPPPRRGRR
jgi:DNA-binding LacI/PurR family transcriptional regulator